MGSESHLRQLIFLWKKSVVSGVVVLCCVVYTCIALLCCLTVVRVLAQSCVTSPYIISQTRIVLVFLIAKGTSCSHEFSAWCITELYVVNTAVWEWFASIPHTCILLV